MDELVHRLNRDYPATAAAMHRRLPSVPNYLKIVMMMKNLGTNKFSGGTDPFEADAWLQNMEQNFDVTRCPENYKKDVATYYLDKDAMHWWHHQARNYAEGVVTWQHFRQDFERKYFPAEARDRLEMQFLEIVQGERRVRNYEAEFTRLRRYTHFGPDNEDAVIHKFQRGLRPEIRSRLQAIEFHSLYELVERAVNVEESLMAERVVPPRQLFAHSPEGQRYKSPMPVQRGAFAQQGRGRGFRAGRTTPAV